MFCGIDRVLLNGNDITSKVSKVMIVDSLGYATTAQLFLKLGQTVSAEPFQMVNIEDNDGELLFGGRVEGFPNRNETIAGTALIVNCRDWSVECEYRQALEHYQNWSISDIYKSLVAKYLPEHTVSNVTETTETTSLRFNGISVNQCLNTLAEMMGWTWQVQASRDHYFGPTFIEKVTEDITDDVIDSSKGKTTAFERDYSTLANRVWVEGGEGYSRNFTEQYIALDEMELTEDSTIRGNYPYRIPVWYPSDGPKVFAVYDTGDGTLENGRIIQLDTGKPEDVAGKKIYTPVNSSNPVLSQVLTPNLDQRILMVRRTQSTHSVISQFDAIVSTEPTENSGGGYVYIRDMEADTGSGISERIRRKLDPSGSPTVNNKLIGYMIRYCRKLKISYVSDVDTASVAEYGVQIDLPKVSRPSITDWSVLRNYADYLLTKHKNPPRKGKVTVYRFKNGQEVYSHNLKSGQLVDVDLTRYGSYGNVKLTKIVHQITADSWITSVDSTLDPHLYSTMLADLMRRIHHLEQKEMSDDVINSVSTFVSEFETVGNAPVIASVFPDDDYGFGKGNWGACEWED